jgi:uncharacterized protein
MVSMPDCVFNVAHLLKAGSGASRHFDVAVPAHVIDVPELTGPVVGTARVVRLIDSLHVSGAFTAEMEQPCARCLEPACFGVRFEADDEFVPVVDPHSGHPTPLDDRWRLDERHNLDLAPLLAEGVIAALPLMRLCRPDCDGIHGTAEREALKPADTVDPRLEPLRRLREAMFPTPPDSES